MRKLFSTLALALLVTGFIPPVEAQVYMNPVKHSSTDVVHECFPVWDIGTSPEGAITESGLTSTTPGLQIRVRANNAALGWTDTFTQSGSTIEGITTIGTYAAPTATKIRFAECETGSGLYQIMMADALYATSGAKSLTVEIQDTSSPGAATQILNINLNVTDIAAIADAIPDEDCTGHTTAGTVGEAVCSTIAGVEGTVNTNSTDIGTAQQSLDSLTGGLILTSGTTDSGNTTSFVDAALTEADTNYWAKNAAVVFTNGLAAGQSFCVTGFVPGTDTINFSPPATQSIGTDQYVLIAAPGCDPFR